MKAIRTTLAVVTAIFVVGAAGFWWWANGAYDRAQILAQHELWDRVRIELRPFFWIHPYHERALLLLAESCIKDEGVGNQESVTTALESLARISDTSQSAVVARLQEAKLNLLLLNRPSAAARQLDRALNLDPNNREALAMRIKIDELSGRFYQTEPLFWQLYEQSHQDQRPQLLREWYMSQFFPLSANALLDRKMGHLQPQEEPSRDSESKRYISFRESEKHEVLGHAALAAWCQREGQPQLALEILEETSKHVAKPLNDPFFVATYVATLVDLGQLERAREIFGHWPGSRTTYDYWKWNAVIAEQYDGKLEQALESYTAALSLWPGPTDWRLRYRRVNCLLQMGRTKEAAQDRTVAETVESLMEDTVHSRVRHALGFLNDPKQLQIVVDFYGQLSRDREVKAWKEHIARLQSATVSGGHEP